MESNKPRVEESKLIKFRGGRGEVFDEGFLRVGLFETGGKGGEREKGNQFCSSLTHMIKYTFFITYICLSILSTVFFRPLFIVIS